MKEINLQSSSDTEFFFIHGYSGSPTDFADLPHILHKKFKANVRCILLKGHGTKIEDLDTIEYEEFRRQTEAALREDLKKKRKIVVLGLSFGAQIALYLAAKYNVEAVVAISTPYKLKFPFNIPKLQLLGHFKKYWDKALTPEEREMRRGAFFYTHIPAKALRIVKHANKDLRVSFSKITCPMLIVHSLYDPLGHHKSAWFVERLASSRRKHRVMLHNKNHNIFFSENRKILYEEVERFVHSVKFVAPQKVAAIIPAYNEEKRIRHVLSVLKRSHVNEIIVVDDGSDDSTGKIVQNLKDVTYIRNETNLGKSAAMQRGVDATKAPIIFFCDADLRGLTPKIVNDMISQVQSGTYDMFIGIRKNIMQKSFLPFALNSGERVLRREIWEKLPESFKHRYRIEVGLNYIARRKGYARYNHYQTLKEQKYGFVKGTMLRWWMNFDVAYAYLLTIKYNIKGERW